MSKATEALFPVVVVRPKRKGRDVLVTVLASYVDVFVASAIVMLLLGACHHEISSRIPALGYLQTLLGLYTLKTIAGAVLPWDGYKLWSRDQK